MATTTQKIEQSLCTFHAFSSNFQNFFCNQDCLFFGSKSKLTKHFLAFDKLLFLVLKRGFLTRDFFSAAFSWVPFYQFPELCRKAFFGCFYDGGMWEPLFIKKIQRAMAASKRASWEGHTPSIKAHISKEVITWPAFAFYYFVLSELRNKCWNKAGGKMSLYENQCDFDWDYEKYIF